MGPGALEEDPRSLRVRAFFGQPVPEPQREELGRFIAQCAQVAPDFRWTPTENLHLTIRFVGNVDRSVVEAVADRLAALTLAGFVVELGDIGTFGRGRMARVMWLGLRAGADGARVLAAQVEAECVRAGLIGEDRPFQAHLTLARARTRDGSRLPDLPATPHLKPWRADALVLYSSRLTKAGAVYEVIRKLPLL
jgi:RNA 2',3'-cyclic 3'-phosphodiesterase